VYERNENIKKFTWLVFVVFSVVFVSMLPSGVSAFAGGDGSSLLINSFHVGAQISSTIDCGVTTLSTGVYHTVGLKEDGTVVAVDYNGYGQLNVSGWINIRQPCYLPPADNTQPGTNVSVTPDPTDNCDGKIAATTADPLEYKTQGTYTIHWTYADRVGNVSTQIQTVIVADTIAPTISVSAPACVTYGKGNGSKANIITVTAQDNCSKSVILQITKVEVFINGGNLVMGNGIYEISGNTVYMNPNENGWSVRITVIAADENGNTQTIQIEKSLIKC